jgi:hypothetical protein
MGAVYLEHDAKKGKPVLRVPCRADKAPARDSGTTKRTEDKILASI